MTTGDDAKPLESTALVLWIAARTESGGGALEGRALAVELSQDGLLGGTEREQSLARVFAELLYDDWLKVDYESWPQDPNLPGRFAFGPEHLQRCGNIRIHRDAWPSIRALRTEAESEPVSGSAGPPSRDVFLCHASEDKAFVRPLAEALEALKVTVWYDEFEIEVGDSLRAKVDEGLAISNYGAVVFSPAFLQKKPWTERELDGLTSKEIGDQQMKVLPIWHGVGRDDVARYSEPLAMRKALNSRDGVDPVAGAIMAKVREQPPPRDRGSTGVWTPEIEPEGFAGFRAPAGSDGTYNGIGYLKLFVRPFSDLAREGVSDIGTRLSSAVDAAEERARSWMDISRASTFDWLSRWEPRSFGWVAGTAAREFEAQRQNKLVASTYAYEGSFSFYTSIGLTPPGQGWKCAYENLWAAETVAQLAIAGAFFEGVEGADELRTDLQLNGIDNAVSFHASRAEIASPTAPRALDSSFTDGASFSAVDLASDPRDAARVLLERLLITFVGPEVDTVGNLERTIMGK